MNGGLIDEARVEGDLRWARERMHETGFYCTGPQGLRILPRGCHDGWQHISADTKSASYWETQIAYPLPHQSVHRAYNFWIRPWAESLQFCLLEMGTESLS